MEQTAKEQYNELLASLKSGSHTYDGRSVLDWDEFTGVEGKQAGKRVVAIQYAGKDSGGGGALLEYAFDPATLAEQPAEEPVTAEEPVKPATAAKSSKQS